MTKTIEIVKYSIAFYELIVTTGNDKDTLEYDSHAELTYDVNKFKKEGYIVLNDNLL